MEEEGSESPTPHTPVAPTPETASVIPEVVAPSTSVVGGELTQVEPASQREELVVYGPHLPSRMCGAYRNKLAKRLRREAEGNLRPPYSSRHRQPRPGGNRRGGKGRTTPRFRPTGTIRQHRGRAMGPLGAGAQMARSKGRSVERPREAVGRRRRARSSRGRLKKALSAGSGLPLPRGRTP